MEKMEIDAVEMTRRIRDAHAAQTRDASPAERIRFFRERARRLHERIAREGSAPPARSTPADPS